MFPAKYQPNPPGGSGEEAIRMVFIDGHLELQIITLLA